MRPYSTHSTPLEKQFVEEKEVPINEVPRKKENGITQLEKQLIEDIYNYKLSGVVERYRRLKWSRRKGNEIKQSLLEKNLISTEEIPTKSGRVVILKFSKTSNLSTTQIKDTTQSDLRQGGITHEYWKMKYAEKFRQIGYQVQLETPIGEGRSVDFTAKKNNFKIAVEIETGKSDILANIKKCLSAKFDRIILVGTNEKSEEKIRQILKENKLDTISKIDVYCARNGS